MLQTRTTHVVFSMLVFMATLPLIAQPRPKPQGERVKTSGKITGGSSGLIYVVSSQGDQFRVKAPTRPDYIKFIGSATPNWLQRGMFVTFVGKFDKKGNSVAPIRALEVFTPNKETKIGAFPDSGLGGGVKNLFSSDDENAKPVPEGAAFKVTGRLTAAKNGKLTVQAGSAAVRVQLADNANVSVNVNSLQFVREGDNVSIDGQYLPQQRRDIVANRLTVSAAEKLGEPKVKPKKDN